MIAVWRFFGLALAACAIFALIDLHLIRKAISLNLALFFLLINSAVFIMYGLDKRAAIKGFCRISENSFHLLALLGGWPAAFVAQSVFHHKTRKPAFQLVHWFVVLASLALAYSLTKFPVLLTKI